MSYLELDVDGNKYQVEYVVDEDVVTVYSEGGSESTQLGGLNEVQVAKMLLRSLIRKGHIQPI